MNPDAPRESTLRTPEADRTSASSMWWRRYDHEEVTALPGVVHCLGRVARIAAGLGTAIGVIGLASSIAGSDQFKDPFRKGTIMTPHSGLMLILSGLSLVLSVPHARRRRFIACVLAVVSAAIAVGTLLEDTLGRDLGLDWLLLHLRHGQGPLRPAAPTSVGIVLMDAAVLTLDLRSRRGPTPAEILGACTAVIGWLAFGGYLYGAIQFYAWARFPHTPAMGVYVSIALLALGVGTMAARPEAGWTAVVASPHVGGHVVRRLLPVAVAIPLLGYLAELGQRAGWYQAPGGSVLDGIAGLIVATVITIVVGRSLDRSDAHRRWVEAQNREWRRFFDGATFGAAFSTLDRRLGPVNDAYARMHGFTPAELEGRPIVELYPPELRAEAAGRLQSAREKGSGRWEATHRRKDGSLFPVLVDVTGIPDEQGKLLYLAAYVQDISREQEAEVAQARLASLVRSADDAIMAEATDGTILDWNHGAERIFGYGSHEIVGRSIWVIVPEDLRGEGESLRARVIGGETVVNFATERIRKDGTRFPIALTLSPIRDAAGNVSGISAIERDITALKELERQREEWTSVVAHDLRQPGATMRLATETLVRAQDEPTRQKAIGHIGKAGAQLDRMVGDLLDATRIETGHLAVEPTPADLNPLVAQAVELLPEVAARCHVEIAPDASRACVDADRFAQVMSNLLSNAHKYGREGAPIDVRVGRERDMVQVTVTNEGQGISRDDMPRLFSKFSRMHSAERGSARGLGLGLFLSRGIVEAHGGKLWAESTPGEKTHFHFMLPRA
jgi:PAS domain S-box-containing protein